jgi:hypothetical protein
MSERLSAVDGHLSLGRPETGHGFRLTATVRTETAGTGNNCPA